MTDDIRTYWPFDVLPPERRTSLHDSELRFFVATHEAGFKPFHENHYSVLGFGHVTEHDVCYLLRGGRGRHWEPRLSDQCDAVRLAPLFGLPETTCIVFDGFDDLTIFSLRWLAGDSLDLSLAGIDVFAKNSKVPLTLSE